ncbi:hypothetical protein EC2865200_5068 [Escherichia coli 2865200]|nr:hypothetical protein EC2865200_5068 [Escherichia coli 2865200]
MEVQSVTDGVKVKVSRFLTALRIQRWGLKLPTCASACSAGEYP